jgi:hypothetical protein
MHAAAVDRLVALPVTAMQVAMGEGATFVAGLRAGTRSAIVVVHDGRVARTVPISGDPAGAAFGAGSAWVATSAWQVRGRFGHALLWRVRTSGRRVQRIVLPGDITGAVAVGAGAVWITNGDYDGRLFRVDPATARLTATIPLDGLASGVATTPGAVWVTLSNRDLLERIDPSSGRVVARIPVGRGPFAVAAAGDRIWVANDGDGTVSEIDARSNQIVAKAIQVGLRAFAIAASGTRVWVVSNTRRHTVVSFDRRAPRRCTSVRIAAAPQGLAVAGHRVALITPSALHVWTS